jgi:hypothetical protein
MRGVRALPSLVHDDKAGVVMISVMIPQVESPIATGVCD